jgi:excisionase family DNA binding protein
VQHLEPRVDPTRIYTPEEAAEIFRVAPGTIRRLFRQGSMGGFQVGPNIRMMGTDLAAFIAAGGARIGSGPGDDPADVEPDDPPAKINSDVPALAEVAA